jgi:hypothetical protein
LGFPAFRAGLTQDAGSFRETSPSRTWRQAGACWIPGRDWELAQMARARIPAAEGRAPGVSFSVAGSTVGGLSGIYCVQLSYPRISQQAQACDCTNKMASSLVRCVWDREQRARLHQFRGHRRGWRFEQSRHFRDGDDDSLERPCV